MKIIFLRAYDFPLGGAPQNRMLGICRGLVEQGHEVEVHQYAPAKLDLPQNLLKSQVYKSVQIYNHAWRWSPVKSKINQFYGLTGGMIKTIRAILKSNKTRQVDYLFINSEKNFYVLPFFILAKLLGVKLGRDLNEYPRIVLYPEKFNNFSRKYKQKTNYRWFDVFFVMTKQLEKYYKPFGKKKSRFLHLPMTVDFDRFPFPVKNPEQSHFITYCGDLSQSKDGTLNLIQSFALIKDEYPNLTLKLVGENKDSSYMKQLRQLISELSIEDRVVLTGFIHPEEIPDTLYQSRLLVLSRPDNIQARGGFPTKLGEYLATGVPVTVSSVGELPDYLEDEKNAFLAKPDDIVGFANAMKRALSDKELSVAVGLAGRDTALKYFSHSAQGHSVSEFLSN
jgi:glycosyltransferase involved in cell wall biosynthesis